MGVMSGGGRAYRVVGSGVHRGHENGGRACRAVGGGRALRGGGGAGVAVGIHCSQRIPL